MYANNKGADQPKKIKFLSDMRARIQIIPTDGGGGGGGFLGGGGGGVRIASRGRFVPVFSSRKQMATYDFHGEVRTPCPLCLRPYQSFKQFGFTFYFLFFAGPGQFTGEHSGSVVECLPRVRASPASLRCGP